VLRPCKPSQILKLHDIKTLWKNGVGGKERHVEHNSSSNGIFRNRNFGNLLFLFIENCPNNGMEHGQMSDSTTESMWLHFSHQSFEIIKIFSL
jgi:hypothetical protein